MAGDVPVSNPWLSPSNPAGHNNGEPQHLVQEDLTALTGPSAPQGAGVPPPAHALPVAPPNQQPAPGWWWLGVHGGAGVTTLEQAVSGGRDAGRAWPTADTPQPVVLVARSGATGLRAAQSAAQQWASQAVTEVDLLGLVVIADAPGRHPRPLRDLLNLVSGAVPRLWEIPWVERWRLGEPPTADLPKQVTLLARDLARLARSA